MTGYEELLDEAALRGLIVKEKDLLACDGRIFRNRVAIRKTISGSRTKRCILAEELGHFYTSFGDIIREETVSEKKQEKRARNWAYERLAPPDLIMTGIKEGYKSTEELAEYLDVSEEFLNNALIHYMEKYGPGHGIFRALSKADQ